jgi:hypothetical protein
MTEQGADARDLKTIRDRAAVLIVQPGNDPDVWIKAAELLKIAEEIENLRHMSAGSRAVGYVKELAPWAAVFVTLFGLFYQAKQNRDDKAETRWEQAFTAVANGSAGPAEAIEFDKFINSKQHKEDARSAAKEFLEGGPSNFETFKRVFNGLYPDGRAENFEDWLDIDRNLAAVYNSAAAKQPIINFEITWITTKIAAAVRQRSGTAMDLGQVVLYDGDLSGVDFSKANLWGFEPERMNMRDTVLNVSGSSFIAAKWNHSAWWQAKSISKNFLERLEADAHFDDAYSRALGYGVGVSSTKPRYCSETDALGVHDTNTCDRH